MNLRMAAVLSLLIAFSVAAYAQTADLTIAAVKADPKYNAGDASTIVVTVKNLGPDSASTAGVRLPKVTMGSTAAQQYGCIDMIDSVLCNVGLLAAGESHDFVVPFVPPFVAGRMTLSPRTESFTIDPNHENDGSNVTAEVVEMADLRTSMIVYPGLQPGKSSNVVVSVENVAARTATGVRATLSIPDGIDIDYVPSNCTRAAFDKVVCPLPDLGIAATRSGFSMSIRPRTEASHQVVLVADAESDTPEWNSADNTAKLAQGVYALADVGVSVSAPPQQDDSGQAPVTVTLTNNSDVAALNGAFAISVGYQAIGSWNAPGWNCSLWEPGEIRCAAGSLGAHSSVPVELKVKFQSREARFGVSGNFSQTPGPNFPATMQGFSDSVVFYRTFAVTNTHDGGAGSLRNALENANAQCSGASNAPPCRVAFQIPAPVPAEGWFTIEPLTPLPAVTVTDFMIDGETQTAETGDSNPRGPEIFLRGTKVTDGEGLFLRSAMADARGMVIGGFPLNGIKTVPIPSPNAYAVSTIAIERNYLGVDPSGSVAVPNGLRGLMAYRAAGTIANNVISGNRRSGVWVEESDSMNITGNRIGVAAASDAPLPNGATGVFINNSAPYYDIALEHNVIEFNQEYGVSSTRLARFSLLQNVIAHNRIAVDIGLDGPTPDYYNGYIAPQPLITSARFANGSTTIEGKLATQRSFFGYPTDTKVYLYANSTAEEGGEEFIGTAPVQGGMFSLAVPGDLRGKFVDGTTHMVINFGDIVPKVSSEFGPVVMVTE